MSRGAAAPPELVLLDVGNTLIGIDLELLLVPLRELGAGVTAGQLARAEAAARVDVSEFLAGGHSSEAGTAREVYLEACLRRLPETVWRESSGAPHEGARSVPSHPAKARARLRELLGDPEFVERLWSRPFPGARRAIDALLRGGMRVAVVSNSDGRVEERLAEAGLRAGLEFVVDSGAVGVEKPDPRIFEIALARAGAVSPERALYAGDIYHVDVVGARRAGIRGVLVDPFGDGERFPCERVRSVGELPALLAGDPGGGAGGS